MTREWLLRCNVAKAAFGAGGDRAATGELEGVSWSPAQRRLELRRDETGLRPLFYTHATDGDLVASTSLRRLLDEPGIAIAPAREVAAAWLAGAPIGPDETLLEGVKRVPAGHVLRVTPDAQTCARWWSPRESGTLAPGEADRFGEVIEGAVERAVGARRSCVFLSGGIDSGAVAAAAGAVAQREGVEPPLALCVSFPGASEEKVQRMVARAAGLELLETGVQIDGLAERALERVSRSLWPTAAAWAPVFDDLAEQARARGAAVLLDGQGGDELLDAGYAAGPLLVRHPLALYDWLRAERLYTGRLRRSVKILGLGLLGRLDRSPAPSPGWLADDLRVSLAARRASKPHDYAGSRAADVLDGMLAAQREETYDRGQITGLEQRHPYWDPEVVSFLDGLPPAALVAGGDPKAPARRYLRRHVPAIPGRWPQPRVADRLSARLGEQLQEILSARGGLPVLAAHTIVRSDYSDVEVPNAPIWRMISLDIWLQTCLGRLTDDSDNTETAMAGDGADPRRESLGGDAE